jgi:hypothetical protein
MYHTSTSKARFSCRVCARTGTRGAGILNLGVLQVSDSPDDDGGDDEGITFWKKTLFVHVPRGIGVMYVCAK